VSGNGNRIVVGDGGAFTNWTRFTLGGSFYDIIVDGGTYYHHAQGWGMDMSGEGNRFIVKNGGEATMVVGTGAGPVGVNVGASVNGNKMLVEGAGSTLTITGAGTSVGAAGGTANSIEVVDGGSFNTANGVSVHAGNAVYVRNGTFNMIAPPATSHVAFDVDGLVEISGTNGLVNLARANLHLNEGAVLRYTLGKTVPALDTPIFDLNGNFYFDELAKVEIDTKALAFAGGGSVMLMSGWSIPALLADGTNVKWLRGSTGTLEVVPVGGGSTWENLVLTVPSEAGTLILVR